MSLDNWTRRPWHGMPNVGLHPGAFSILTSHLLAVHFGVKVRLGDLAAREIPRNNDDWLSCGGGGGLEDTFLSFWPTSEMSLETAGFSQSLLTCQVICEGDEVMRFFTYPRSGPLRTRSVTWKYTKNAHARTKKVHSRTRWHTEHKEMGKKTQQLMIHEQRDWTDEIQFMQNVWILLRLQNLVFSKAAKL